MGKPRNASMTLEPLRGQAAHELYNSPKSYNYQGRHPYELPEESKKEYRVNTCMGEQQEIGAENA